MPLVGSSRTRSSGLPTNAFATKTRWVWPPDNRPIRRPRRSWGKTRRPMPWMARMPPRNSTATSRSSRTGSVASDMVQGQRELGEAVLHLEEICHPEGLVREGQPFDRVQPDERGIRLARDRLRDRGVREGFIADVAEVARMHRIDDVLDLR